MSNGKQFNVYAIKSRAVNTAAKHNNKLAITLHAAHAHSPWSMSKKVS